MKIGELRLYLEMLAVNNPVAGTVCAEMQLFLLQEEKKMREEFRQQEVLPDAGVLVDSMVDYMNTFVSRGDRARFNFLVNKAVAFHIKFQRYEEALKHLSKDGCADTPCKWREIPVVQYCSPCYAELILNDPD